MPTPSTTRQIAATLNVVTASSNVAQPQCLTARDFRHRPVVAIALTSLSVDSAGGLGIVEAMKLDVYRSCTRQEKREVLDAFWRSNVQPSAHIHQAAYQYGPYAIICLVAVVAELVLVIAVSVGRADVVAVVASLVEVFVVWSLSWAVVRNRAIRRTP